MVNSTTKLLITTAATGLMLVGVFVATVLHYRTGLSAAIHQTIIERDAAVLHPFVLQQLTEARANGDDSLAVVLRSAHQDGILAVAIFDANGRPWRHLPASLLFADLPLDDLLRLQTRQPISRFYAQFSLDRYFSGVAADQRAEPVLEILLPLYQPDPGKTLVGFVQYFVDARALTRELATVDQRIGSQTTDTLLLGSGLITALVASGSFWLVRSQRIIAERNARLTRANFELTLSAKASALGQITSHLMHGLQGPVAGLRAAMAGHAGDHHPDWQSASEYTERVQTLVQETVTLLGDTRTQTHYELTGEELITIIRKRHATEARTRRINLEVTANLPEAIDSHRGSVLCLIANNLVQNALQATPAHGTITTTLTSDQESIVLKVQDTGPGIPEALRSQLFSPGVSGRVGGTGLGLAISQLLARQIDGVLTLDHTGPEGTAFTLVLPVVVAG